MSWRSCYFDLSPLSKVQARCKVEDGQTSLLYMYTKKGRTKSKNRAITNQFNLRAGLVSPPALQPISLAHTRLLDPFLSHVILMAPCAALKVSSKDGEDCFERARHLGAPTTGSSRCD